ncbi:MAG: hypothetical protein ABIK65_04960 [Candidatus Eisenbacteria bacterium]
MRLILKIALLAVATLAIQCTSGSGPTDWVPDFDQAKWDDLEEAAKTVRLGDTFKLRVGRTAYISGAYLWVVFADVPSDGRCPIDGSFTCFWEGVAFVDLWVRQDIPNRAPGEPVELVVHTTDTGPYSKHVDHEAYTLTLGGLVPYPTYKEDGINPQYPGLFQVPQLGEYIVTLTVTRAAPGSPAAD